MEMEKKKHYAKLDMHNIKNTNGRIVKDDSMSGQSETDGLDCQERVQSALASTKYVEQRSS